MQPLERILERFEQLSAVPRGTKTEARLRAWLQEWAGAQGLECRTDAVGNLLIEVPASPGYEEAPTIVLQGHMDMVWGKTAESSHDFARDPIRVLRLGDWLKADGTTLGADNGIAIALMMALAEEPGLAHPRLEFLLTVEEEYGATGARYIDPTLISGRMLLNLDSEDEGVFTIGCAGGWTLDIHLPAKWAAIEPGWRPFRLRVDGLRGGHSGGDIDKNRGNAIKLLGRALAQLEAAAPLRLGAGKGGTVRNAIPREAEVLLAIPSDREQDCRERLDAFQVRAAAELAGPGDGLRLTLEAGPVSAGWVTVSDSHRVVQLLNALPDGVMQMSTVQAGLVETSNNIGVMELKEDGLHIVSNHRSQRASRLEEIMVRVDSIAQLAGARTTRNDMTAPWEPGTHSPLLEKCRQVYEEQFGAAPKVESTHGGLECGLLSTRFPGLDCLSLGPTIINPHSPDEALFIPSVDKVWTFLTALLRTFR